MRTNQIEIWRCEYKRDAYVDQLGLERDAWVVYEQLLLDPVESFDQFEGYSQKWYKDVGTIAEHITGRRFKGTANLVDYVGGTHWGEIDENDEYIKTSEPGFWREPYTTKGYCHPDGSPIERIKDET